MMMVVGLGNPGRRYAATRHNVGFMTVDALVRRHGTSEATERMGAWVGRTRIAGSEVLLVKPQTFMNASGEAVGRLWRWYKLGLDEILLVSDDLDLPFGRLRLRQRGSAGGHNGLKSIFSHLGSQEIGRLKIGIGRSGRDETIDYVLSEFSADERTDLPIVLAEAADAVESVLREGIVAAMNRINPGAPSEPPLRVDNGPAGAPGGRRAGERVRAGDGDAKRAQLKADESDVERV